jgi:hypothetical protein
MKTAKEKAINWLQEMDLPCSEWNIDALAKLLKEQDRDTRHACAQAVVDDYTGWHAHDTIMNVRAV